MKRPLHCFVAVGTLSGVLFACDQKDPGEPGGAPGAAPAEEQAAAETIDAPAGATKSTHFETVAAHLDLGGTFLGYMDVAGDLDRILATAQKFLDTIREETGEDIPELDLKPLISQLGLQSVAAVGGSSMPLPGDRYRNQGFVHTPDGPKGLLTLGGTEAKPLMALERAPAGTDIIVEQELRLAELKDIVLGIYEQLPKDQGIPPIDQMMQQPIPNVDLTIEQALDQANGRILFLAKFDPEQKVVVPAGPQPMEIPAVDFLLDLQGFGWVFEKFQGFLPQEGPFQREAGDGFTKLTMQLPPEVPFSFFQPVLLHEQATNRLVLASRQAFLDACVAGTGDKITGDAAFQAVFEGLPDEGNSLTYLSPRVKDVVGTTVRNAMEQQGAPDGAGQIADAILGSLDTVAAVTVVKPNGIHSVANSASSIKSGLVGGALVPLAMAGFASYSSAQTVELAMADVAPDNANVQDRGDAAVDAASQMAGVERAIAALRAYAVDNNGQFPDTVADLTPGHLSEQEAETALKWQTPNGPTSLVYFSGLSVASEGNPIVLASPEPDNNGLRAVAHADGTTELVDQDTFFNLARAALEQAN